ncbi:phosphoglycolate phosphatase [Moraxella nasovis]|uniref:phosphoglycolate phosphatase n=1 Tax=Moraxella nasovis TaxID=2904121 RepID=UPI001F612EE1|nr:phosphoglycolate phosphatase [Moraxella nasovis]UNU73983.1 phosphoglycolate phosphatase [Moraxella nasovis]
MKNPTKSLIIFDLDGTLIDSVPDLAAATNDMLTWLNAPKAPINLVRNWVGNGSMVLVQRALAWAGLDGCDEKLDQAHELFLTYYATGDCKHTKLYHGVKDGLQRLLDAGFILSLATNKPERFLPNILQSFNLQETFTCVVGGDTLSNKKPDPMPLLYICNKLKISPQHAIMVGDSKNDILAGKAATMTTLALSYGYNYGESITQSKPDAVFDEFGALVNYIITHYQAKLPTANVKRTN